MPRSGWEFSSRCIGSVQHDDRGAGDPEQISHNHLPSGRGGRGLVSPHAPVRNVSLLTFKQAQEAGGSVRKGEHGFKVYFVKQLELRDEEAEETRLVPMLREYTVFNVAQCENLPDKVIQPQPPKVRHRDARDALADEFMTSSRADIREWFGEAYYRPSDD
jgi:antirestriction protein ArdC